tara:strand:- start:2001 stop:2231 length:231 start_codon:yes stop_codon:yes gene_type:complete
MGNKLERQNQHQKRLKSKIKRFEKRGWSIAGLQKELAYCTGEADRATFDTGHNAGDIKAQEKFLGLKLKRRQGLQE